MRCALQQTPERAGRGYQCYACAPPALGKDPVLPDPRTLGPGPGTGPRKPAAAVPRRDDGREVVLIQRDARDAWWVRTSAAVTAASATTAARAAAGSVCAGVAEEASRWALRSSRAEPSRPAS